MLQLYIIRKNTARYPGVDPNMPAEICVMGTKASAEALAERLSNWNAGCDFSFYVVEEDKNNSEG